MAMAGLAGLVVLLVIVYGAYQFGQSQVPLAIPTSTPIPEPTLQIEVTPMPPKLTTCPALEILAIEDLAKVSQKNCLECGGKWEIFSNFLGRPGCNPKTSDAGQKCTDESECIGMCLAKDKKTDFGACSEYKYSLGCYPEFVQGSLVQVCRD